MNEEDGNKRLYPPAPLEENVSAATTVEQQQQLLEKTPAPLEEDVGAAATVEHQRQLLQKPPETLEDEVASATAEHQQHLLAKPPAPPSYDQATGTEPVNGQPTSGSPHVVVITHPVTTYGPEPVDIQCPYCHNFCRTRLRSKPTSQTHLFALILCLLQLYCCVCLPYCMSSCMNTNHYCGMCDQYLGTYKR